MAEARPSKKRNVFQLVSDLPTTVKELVQGEIALLKAEIIGKLKALGIGAAILVGAAVVLFVMLVMLFVSVAFALSLVMPGWLAAIVVALFLLVVAAILAVIGIRIIKAQMPPLPEESINSIKRDLHAIKGIGGPKP